MKLHKSDVVLAGLGQGLGFLGTIIGLKVLTNLLAVEEYGKLSLVMAIAGIVGLFTFGPLGQIVVRFYSVCKERICLNDYKNKLFEIYLQSIIFIVSASFIVCGIIFFLSPQWLIPIALGIMFSVIYGVFGGAHSLLLTTNIRKEYNIILGLEPWVRLGMAVAFIIGVSASSNFVLLGYIVGSFIIFLYVLAVIKDKVDFGIDKNINNTDLRKEMISYGSPFLFFALFASISQYGDRWIINSFWSLEEVGLFAVKYQIASAPIMLVMAILTQLIMPRVFHKAGDYRSGRSFNDADKMIYINMLLMIAIFAFISGVFYFYGNILIILLTSNKYLDGENNIWLFVVGIGLFNIAQFLITSGLARNKSKVYLKPKIIHALVSFITGLVLIPNFGVQGAVYAILLSSIFYLTYVISISFIFMREQK